MNLKDLNDLFRHMEWADASVWRAVLASDTARDDVKLRELFYHVHMVQRAFLRVWQGEMRYTPFPTFEDNSSLIAWARSYYSDAFAHLKSWTTICQSRSTFRGLQCLQNRSVASLRTRRSGKLRSKSRCTVCIIAAKSTRGCVS